MTCRLCLSLLVLLLAGSSHGQRIRCAAHFPIGGAVSEPRVDGTGTHVVAVRNGELYHWDLLGWTENTIVTGGGFKSQTLSISDDGLTVAVVATWDFGDNPDGSEEVFLVGTDGSFVTQVTQFSTTVGEIAYLALSGDGQYLAFGGPIDPIGSNPNLYGQIFTIRFDGSQLIPTTSAASGALLGLSISDDGDKLVFLHDGDLGQPGVDVGDRNAYRIRRNRTELAAIDPPVSPNRVRISGDGSRILTSGSAFRVYDWDLVAAPTVISDSTNNVSITDDGTTIFYWSDDVIGRVPATGGTPTEIFGDLHPLSYLESAVAGDGSRIVFKTGFGELPGTANPDASFELIAADGDGNAIEQLTDFGPQGQAFEATISASGTRVAFSLFNGTGGVYTAETGGTKLQRVYDGVSAGDTGVAADGSAVLFNHFDPDCGPNGAWSVTRSDLDGSLVPLLPACDGDPPPQHLDVSSTGLYVMQGYLGNELHVQPLDASSAPLQITFDGGGLYNQPRISGDGQWAVFQEQLPPNFDIRIFRVPTDGSGASVEIATDGTLPDVDSTGNRIVYESDDDPLGSNPDGNEEIFLYDVALDTLAQLTSDGGQAPILSGNGEWLWYSAAGQKVRRHLASGTIQRFGGLAEPGLTGPFRDRYPFNVDHSGNRAVVASFSAVLSSAPCSTRVYMIEFDLPPAFAVSRTSPTLVWDVDPRYDRYDILRGDLAELASGTLGAVTCIEEDSVDAISDDPVEPLPGEGFFYLYRGSGDVTVPVATWGESSVGIERVPASGGCVAP